MDNSCALGYKEGMSNNIEHNNDGQATDLDKIVELKITTVLEPFTIETPNGLISSSGQRELQNYLYDQASSELPDDFEWIWCNKRGTLPKRVQVHYFKTRQLKLTPAQISEIGNIARRNSDTAKTVILDFTNRIDWHSGDFGDHGSCFWSKNAGAKEIIEENGFAVRAWKRNSDLPSIEYNNLHGYARAWIAPIADNRLIVFNGYGETSLFFARLLSLKFNCGYKRIGLTNNGDDSGLLYINGGSSFVLGDMSKIENMTSYDLEWTDEESIDYCASCDYRLYEPYNAFTFNGREVVVCSECAHTCQSCEENFTYDLDYDDTTESDYCRACMISLLEARRADEAYMESEVD